MKNKFVTVAAIQYAVTGDMNVNLIKTAKMVEQAAKKGAQIICLQELYRTVYFPQYKNAKKDENPNSAKNIDTFVKQTSEILMRTNPKATPENIKHTAEIRKIPVEQVIRELIDKEKRKNGGQ